MQTLEEVEVNPAITRHRKVHIIMDKSIWCSYKEDCKLYHTIQEEGLCSECIYKRKIDIPNLINEKIKELNK